MPAPGDTPESPDYRPERDPCYSLHMIDFTFQEVRSGQQWGVTARDEMTANKELAYSLGMVPNEFFLVSSRVLSSITF